MEFSHLIVYWCLKTLIIMAKFELKFLSIEEECSIRTFKDECKSLNIHGEFEMDQSIIIEIVNSSTNETQTVYLDKSTAIKFAKTLRTEINKMKESEVQNG